MLAANLLTGLQQPRSVRADFLLKIMGIPEGLSSYIRFVVFKAVTMKSAVFLDVTPFGSCKNRYF
jgi:hypothetical protein